MENLLSHQKKIGIIGSTPDANNFIIKANEIGFFTYQLCQKKEELNKSFYADKRFIGTLNDPHIQKDFIQGCDLLVYFDDSISLQQLEEAEKSILIPQGEDLLAIAHDRVLQKAFKESLSLNIAPYRTIVKEEDIQEAISSIGYPAVLRTNFIQSDRDAGVAFIYEEADIEKASELLKYGTCVLESWLVVEHELAISVVKTASGQTQLYPIIKKNHRNDRLASVKPFISENKELINEIKRVAEIVAANISFIGTVTIDFIVSPAQTLYIGDIYPYPNILTRYSEGNPESSIMRAHLRAIASLPLPTVNEEQEEFVYVPIYADQSEQVNELMTLHPNWIFSFYPIVKEDTSYSSREIGYVLMRVADFDQLSEQLKSKEV